MKAKRILIVTAALLAAVACSSGKKENTACGAVHPEWT